MPLLVDRRTWLALAGVAGLASALPRRAVADLEVGRVAVLLGDAVRHAASGPLRLEAGAAVAEGDEVETGRDSRLELAFIDGSSLTLGPESRAVIQAYRPSGDAAQAVILLVAGILKAVVGKGVVWQSFQVETETAIASVRGTQWIMEQTAEGSAVFVLEGLVAVTPRSLPSSGKATEEAPAQSSDGSPASEPSPSEPSASGPAASPGPLVLAPGEGTDVLPGTLPTPPKAWGEARREAALARVAFP